MRMEYFGFAALALVLIGGLFLAKYIAAPADMSPASETPIFTIGSITVTDAWVAAPVGDQPRTAAYFSIRNDSLIDDRLMGISSPSADMAHLHRTVTEDNVSRMEAMNALILPGNAEVHFAPGGMHVMLMGLTAPLSEGDTISLSLEFLEAGDLTIEAPVRARADMMDMN